MQDSINLLILNHFTVQGINIKGPHKSGTHPLYFNVIPFISKPTTKYEQLLQKSFSRYHTHNMRRVCINDYHYEHDKFDYINLSRFILRFYSLQDKDM